MRRVQRKALARDQVNRVQRLKAVLQFNAIGADVLHRRAAHGAGDEGQILQAKVAILKRPRDQTVPVFPCARFHNEGFGGFFDQAAAHQLDFKHQRLDVTRQNNIAAPAQHKLGCGAQFWMTNHSLQIFQLTQTHQRKRFGDDMKGVVGLERDVFLD